MKVVWTKHAYEAWLEIAQYISETFGLKALQDFQKNTLQWESTISTMPEAGRVEPLLQGMQKVYRSVVVGRHSKMVYSVEENVIKIDAFWDTRREPTSQVNGLQ